MVAAVNGFLRRFVLGERHCRVIFEVPDLGMDAWRRLTAEPGLSWRRLPASRQPSGVPSLPRKRRERGRIEPLTRVDTPVPALVEASGPSFGTASAATQRLAARATAALRMAGLQGEVVGAAASVRDAEPINRDSVWPASDGVLIFGPPDQAELDRRFALTASTWALDLQRLRRPSVGELGEGRRRAWLDVGAGLCVLPLLLMTVPTVGPWLGTRSWAVLLAASVVCVAGLLLVVQALSHRRPVLARVRSRALAMSVGLLVLLVAARAITGLPVPPSVVLAVAVLLVAALVPVALRLLPTAPPTPVLVGVPLLLAIVAAPVGELLDGVYLGRLGLRVTDVELTFAQLCWSGAFFGLTALAGLALAAALWGVFYQLDAVGGRRTVPPAPWLAVLGLVYLAALLALAANIAWTQAGPGPDGLPGRWAGLAPSWVCWSPANGGQSPAVAFTGRALPPTDRAVAWLGNTPGRSALWSADSGGVTVSGQVQVRLRDAPGPCQP